MTEDLVQRVVIEGSGNAAAIIRGVVDTLQRLEKQAVATGQALARALGADLAKPLAAVRAEARGFGVDLAEAAERAAKALRGDVAAIAELRTALRGAVTEQKALAEAARASQAAGATAARASTATARNAAQGRAKATADDLRAVRQRWRVREASERDERRGIETTGNAWATAQRRRLDMMDRSTAVEARRQREADRGEATKARAESIATDRRIRDVGRVWRMRERSEAAEMRHVRAVSRERDAMRRRALSSGRHAVHHGHSAMRSLNHPVHESVGFALAAGAAAGGAFAEHVVRASEAFDSSMSRLRMFAPNLDADAIRRQSLGDSIALGVDASKIVDTIAKSVRDGVPAEIAKTLPKSIVQTAQVMGGDIERLTDSLAEGIQESTAMGWIKSQSDARRFLNLEAGLSTTAGNTSAKTEQFIAAGGLGHGKEMGLDLEKTMAYGAMLNASGSRTGQASARFMGQLSQNVPKMFDKYRTAVESRKNSEEDRAVRSAPGKLGYGGVREMQSRIMVGPEGLIDFATRLQRLDDKARKLVLEGYGFSEQGGAMLAELGSNGGAKGKAVLARAHELAEQKEANDYLSEKFSEWSKSLSFMLQQIEKGWQAIENEIGDVIKDDVIAPLRDWWVELSEAIVHSDLKNRVHRAIVGFVHGLGFEDVRHALDAITRNVHGFDLAGFATGIGEGIRSTVDSFRSLAGVFGAGADGISAQTVGRVATGMLGLSLALKAVSPVLSIMTEIVEGVRALGAVLKTAQTLGLIMGIAGAGEGAGAFATIGAGAAATGVGLAAMLGVAVVGGALAVAVMNWDAIKTVMGFGPKEDPATAAARPVKRLEDQSWWDFLTGRGVGNVPLESDNDRAARLKAQADAASRKASETLGIMRGLHGGVTASPGGIHPSAYQGGDGWRDLLQRASYEPSDSGDVVRGAMLDTASGVRELREAVDRLSATVRTASTAGQAVGTGVAGFGGGGGEGGGNANLRYGRGGAGGYRSTPGTGSYGNPSKSLLDLIAKSEGAGYNVSWGNGRFLPGGKEQNLTGKSLNEILALGDTMRRQPGARNSSALGRYQITGSTLRDLMKRLGLNGSEKFDEAMQDRLASKLISDEGPRALGRWEGLKRGNLMSQAQALLRSGSIASQPGDVSSNGGGGGSAGKAVDLAMGMQGAGERSAQQILGAYMHPGEWCADFVNGALAKAGIKGSGSAMARSFSGWGRHVGLGEVQKGDVIEENAHGHGVNHVGLATGNVQRDRSGNVTAVEMVSGNYGRMVRKNWERVGIIADLRRSDQAIAAAARKVGERVAQPTPAAKPADIAGKVRSHGRSRPAPGDAPAGRMTTADNSTTHHTWHVYGEPARRAVQAHLDDRRSGSTVDLDAFA